MKKSLLKNIRLNLNLNLLIIQNFLCPTIQIKFQAKENPSQKKNFKIFVNEISSKIAKELNLKTNL